MTLPKWRMELVVCVLAAAHTVSTARESDGGQKIPPPANPQRTSWDYPDWPGYVVGTITEVFPTSISVRPAKGGEVETYPAHTALFDGKVMKDATGLSSYRLQDAVVGDFVCLGTVKEPNGVTYCIGIRIEQRPGGRLPAGQKWDSIHSAPWEDRNAIADLDEFGIPLPEKVRRGMFSTDAVAKRSDAIWAASKKTPPAKIEKLKD